MLAGMLERSQAPGFQREEALAEEDLLFGSALPLGAIHQLQRSHLRAVENWANLWGLRDKARSPVSLHSQAHGSAVHASPQVPAKGPPEGEGMRIAWQRTEAGQA